MQRTETKGHRGEMRVGILQHEARWQSKLIDENKETPFNPAPTFLGVKFDRTLSFRPHCQALQERLHKRIKVLRCLAGRNRGMAKEELRPVYITCIFLATEYCAAAYLPALRRTILNKLQILQNLAARVITSCCRDTSVELLNDEVTLTPLTVKAELKAASAFDKPASTSR